MKSHLCFCALLLALAVAVYGPTIGFGFAPLDDALFISENPFVITGLNERNVSWAFSFRTAASHANWIPLTFLSLMLDAEWGDGDAAAFHFTNLVLHAANAVLLYGLLFRLTGHAVRSAFVAALFCVHPLHVESVAWATERKDVLSTFFGFGALWFYAGFVQTRRATAYLLSLTAFGLSLMSKQTLVTLPCALLLLDYWPLRRFEAALRSEAARRDTLPRLLLEKLPYLLLAVVFSAVVLQAQQGAMGLTLNLALPYRLANAAIAYVLYAGKAFWPTQLSVFYPHPAENVSIPLAVGCAALLAAVSAVVVVYRRRVPQWFTGWFWFLGTLVPMIGIVQVGEQQMADRYTYIPFIGLYIACTWSIPAAAPQALMRRVYTGAAAIIIGMLSLVAGRQVALWEDGITLYRHGIAVTTDNATLHQFLASELHSNGQTESALEHLREAERLNPRSPEIQFNWGIMLQDQGDSSAAVERFFRALKGNPCHVRAHVQLGAVFEERGDREQALQHFREAVRCDPRSATAQYNWGRMLLRSGRFAEAASHFRIAIEEDPRHDLAHTQLGTTQAVLGDTAGATASLRTALMLKPDLPQAHCNLGLLLLSEGRLNEAVRHFQSALAAAPDMPEARQGLAAAEAALQSRK